MEIKENMTLPVIKRMLSQKLGNQYKLSFEVEEYFRKEGSLCNVFWPYLSIQKADQEHPVLLIKLYDTTYREPSKEGNIFIEVEHDYYRAENEKEVFKPRLKDQDFLEKIKTLLDFSLNQESEEKEIESWTHLENMIQDLQ